MSASDYILPPDWGLTAKEEAILRCLLRQPSVSKAQLMEQMYGEREQKPTMSTINVMVSNMRKKLRKFDIEILTLHGRGALTLSDSNYAKIKTSIDRYQAYLDSRFSNA